MVPADGRVAPVERAPVDHPDAPVNDRRAVPGMVFGVLALVLALLALALSNRVLLVLAAIAALASVILVLTAPDVPLRYRDRRTRQREAERLVQEADLMAARAARFEGEAVAARKEPAAAMLASPLASSGQRASDPVASHPLDAIESLEAEGRRRHDDVTEAEAIERRERAEATDEVERLRRLHDGLAEGGAGVVDHPDGSRSSDDATVDAGGRITDLSSGLFNQLFFDASLDKRVSAARRGLRPLTVAFVEVSSGGAESGVDPKAVAAILTETLREADTVGRTTDGLYALLLEDTPENGAIWTLERIRRQITTDIDGVMVRAGVSCYPAYAFTAEQLVAQARQALDDAREWNQDRIEVTTEEPDDA